MHGWVHRQARRECRVLTPRFSKSAALLEAVRIIMLVAAVLPTTARAQVAPPPSQPAGFRHYSALSNVLVRIIVFDESTIQPLSEPDVVEIAISELRSMITPSLGITVRGFSQAERTSSSPLIVTLRILFGEIPRAANIERQYVAVSVLSIVRPGIVGPLYEFPPAVSYLTGSVADMTQALREKLASQLRLYVAAPINRLNSGAR
jgi:hypothetical protein